MVITKFKGFSLILFKEGVKKWKLTHFSIAKFMGGPGATTSKTVQWIQGLNWDKPQMHENCCQWREMALLKAIDMLSYKQGAIIEKREVFFAF